MKVSINTKKPTVNITVNKNRQKLYSESKVFLKDSTEFEIELFNPTSDIVLSKISLNGNYINGGGLVLYPGQRIYLERYLDSNKKFKFGTYTVERNDVDVQQAVQNNGIVNVEFFKEKKWQQLNSSNNFYTNTSSITFNTRDLSGTTTNPPYTFTTSTGDSTTINYSADLCSTPISNTTTSSYNTTINEIGDAMSKKYSATLDSMETGRVSEGSKSNQSFTDTDMEFETHRFHNISYMLLPESEKILHSNDIKVYCPNCGNRRRKDNWNFCPSCGSNYDE